MADENNKKTVLFSYNFFSEIYMNNCLYKTKQSNDFGGHCLGIGSQIFKNESLLE